MGDTLAHFQPRRSRAMAMTIGSMLLFTVPPTFAAPTEAPPESFSELIAQGEAHRAAERYAESARMFATAYDALGERDQSGLKGKIAINNAVDDFRLAQDQDPGSIVLFEEEATLLERYGERKGEVPEGLVEELARVKMRIVDLRRMEAQRKTDVPQAQEKVNVADVQEEVKVADARRSVTAAVPKPEKNTMAPQENADELLPSRYTRTNRRADVTVLALGSGFLVSGTVLIANGSWNITHVIHRSRDLMAATAAPKGDSELRVAYYTDVAKWFSFWYGVGTGLVVGGAVLSATGIALTTWASVRLARAKRGRRPASRIALMTSGRGLGFSLGGRF